MSKFLRFLFLSVALLSGLTMGGQSLSKQIRLAERAKEKYGETDERYLDALVSLSEVCLEVLDIESYKRYSTELISLIEKRDDEEGIPPHSDQRYIEALEDYLSWCILSNDNSEIIEYAPTLLTLYEKTGDNVTEGYFCYLSTLILSYHVTHQYLKEYLLYSKYDELSEIFETGHTEPHYLYLMCKVETLSTLYKTDEYLEAAQELRDLTIYLYGGNSVEALLVSIQECEYYALLDRTEDAIQALNLCYKIFNAKDFPIGDSRKRMRISAQLHSIEGAIYLSSDPQRAEKCLLSAIDEYDVLEKEIDDVLSLRLGLLYLQNGEVDQAIDWFEDALLYMENASDNSSIKYVTALSDLALCHQKLGMNSVAITIFDSASQTVETNYGRQHPLYGMLEQNISNFYVYMADFPSAITHCQNALECYEGVYGRESRKYAACLQNLGSLYHFVGDFSSTKEVLLQAIEILNKMHSPESILAYSNLILAYSREGEIDACEELIGLTEWQIKTYELENSRLAAFFWGSAGDAYAINLNFRGKPFYEKALDILNNIGGENTIQYFRLLQRLCLVSFYDYSQSEDFIPLLLDEYKYQYLGDVAFLNGAERESLVSGSGFSHTKDILFSSRDEGKYDTELYDFLLFNKGLLLGTSIGYAKAVYDLGEEELVGKYETLQNLRRYINGEPVTLEGDYTTERAKTEATALEREITLYLRQNGGYTGGLDCSHEDVRNALGDDEIAVEFVNYKDYTDNMEYYVALLAKSEWSKPKYVKLCKKEELDKYVTQSPNNLYGIGKYVSNEAYNLIWTPLEQYFESARTVYFSPAGYINTLAVECLYDGTRRFDERYNAVRLTSTREICNKRTQQSYASAVLYGGLTYDEDDDTMIAESRSVQGDVSGFRERYNDFTRGMTRKGWNYLPGTSEEVSQISSIFADAAIDYEIYSSEKGNEESFKALSGADFGLMHLATHGFYMTETAAERSDFFSSYTIMGQPIGSFGIGTSEMPSLSASLFNTEISPMQRSGLILSGGNRAWTGQSIPDGVEDGILTASEVASLDFSSCDIVVLSACETGLGEISDEGVFGLQRAFKNAGVNTIIMSLWEVDDAATSLMMQTFYKNLVSGKPKRESFLTAQEKVREQYHDPRYWTAFIMLD